MMLLKDGVKYFLHEYASEEELGQMVIEHYREIFGANTLYFDPQTMKAETGIATRSDGIIIATDTNQWYLLEVELAQHSLDEHITPQIMKFRRAYRQTDTKKKICDAIFTIIKQDPYRTAALQTQKIEDTYKHLNETVENPPTIAIVIDQKTPELEAVRKDLQFETKATEFRTYTRENAGINVHIHEFEPLYEKLQVPRTLLSILIVLEQIYKKGKTYDEATEIAAKKLKLYQKDIRHRCTTVIGLTSDKLRKLLENKEKLQRLIIGKFPDHEDAIREALS